MLSFKCTSWNGCVPRGMLQFKAGPMPGVLLQGLIYESARLVFGWGTAVSSLQGRLWSIPKQVWRLPPPLLQCAVVRGLGSA